MCKRTSMMATAMICFGSLLGYAAAWGEIPVPRRDSDEGSTRNSAPVGIKSCCDAPDRSTVFVSAQGEGKGVDKGGDKGVKTDKKPTAGNRAARPRDRPMRPATTTRTST